MSLWTKKRSQFQNWWQRPATREERLLTVLRMTGAVLIALSLAWLFLGVSFYGLVVILLPPGILLTLVFPKAMHCAAEIVVFAVGLVCAADLLSGGIGRIL